MYFESFPTRGGAVGDSDEDIIAAIESGGRGGGEARQCDEEARNKIRDMPLHIRTEVTAADGKTRPLLRF